ncbi:MAG: glycosyltransferase family 2 protein [Desulfuromonadales bacterium]
MPESVLEIFLITYNRGSCLDDTLRKLADSLFARCRFTVLDNCSTDNTPQIAAKYSEYFEDFHVVRHPLNIGGDANYLRAVELSTSRYTWILCDDDFYDFSAVDEIVGVLQAGSHDLVIAGPLHPVTTVRNCSKNIQELVHSGFLPHFTLSFFPAIIFRTELFGYECVAKGYKFCADCFPNFAFINKAVRDNFMVYIPSAAVVIRNDVNDSVLSPLSWYNGLLNCCSSIPDRRLRYATIEEATRKRGFLKSLAFWIALERHIDANEFYRKILNIMAILDCWQRMKLFLLLPFIVLPLPLSFMIAMRQRVYRFMRVPENEIPPVKVIDRDA